MLAETYQNKGLTSGFACQARQRKYYNYIKLKISLPALFGCTYIKMSGAKQLRQKRKKTRTAKEDTTMEVKELTLSDIEKATGGKLDSEVTDYLNEVIYRAKRADKSLEQCIQDFYRYNKYFNKEQEEYIRAHWNDIA